MLLAQISDLHVRPAGERYKDAVDSNRMLAEAIEHLNRLDPRPDLVLITGDLVDEGLLAEYASLRALLAGLELPYLLMPGNHDDRERPGAILSGTHLSAGERPQALPHRSLCRAHHCPRHDGAGRPSRRGRRGGPGVARDGARGHEGAPAVVLMHHPPIACGIPYLDKYMCRRPERIAPVIGRFANVERVLCGHVHRPILQRWAGTLLCSCPSTATQIALQPSS